MLTTSLKRTIATALSGVAIAGIAGAPAASATPNLRPDPAGDPDSMAADATPDAGLDLSSAAIGAATGTGLLIVVLAGGLAWRRPITRPHGATRA
jgi:hypothetical protein